MERKTVNERIETVKDELAQLQNKINAMSVIDRHRYPADYESLSIEATIRSEKISCRLRHLVYATTTIKKADLMTPVAEAHGIEIEYKDSIFKVVLPMLLPKRKYQKKPEFSADPLYFALEKYVNTNPIEKFRECVVCFIHVYSAEQAHRRMRDYDNIELKHMLDVVSTFVMVDDTSYLCDAYNTTMVGEKDCTCINVMSKEQFPVWIRSDGKTHASTGIFPI